ncbi:MAG: Holliday junction resolvase RuvX [Candidatus Saccharibacteria bacterium]|nr:Holliday junction resolvase RuvX [Candidatus Saccharibacteria bacterium]MCY4088585.1 Holliday junction resolvase RuvX [Candidatus Saccharibacteria bacterium]
MIKKVLKTEGQLLALDIGSRRVGVARAHSRIGLVEPLKIIDLQKDSVWLSFEELFQAYQPISLIVGLPFNRYGQPTQQTTFIETWVEELKAQLNLQLPIIYQDETLSTHQAQTLDLKSTHPRYKDDLAACVILMDYLEYAKSDSE